MSEVPPVRRGDSYLNADGFHIYVTRVARDKSWADTVVTPREGRGWSKRQPLRDGRLPYVVERARSAVWKLLGCDPTIGGELSAVDYIRQQRDGSS